MKTTEQMRGLAVAAVFEMTAIQIRDCPHAIDALLSISSQIINGLLKIELHEPSLQQEHPLPR